MFEFLKEHSRILVTGPGRSGTRICAKMVANDTGLPYIDEVEIPNLFIIGQEVKAIEDLSQDSFVLHCPTICRYLLDLPKDLFIIFMLRDPAEIKKSQQRVSVRRKSLEREYNKYGFSRFFSSGLPRTYDDIIAIKHRFWETKQKPSLRNYMEIQYYDLMAHPMWIEPEKRRNFRWNQTS
jgi:hypothetical protein